MGGYGLALLTVVVAAHGVSAYLPACLDSVLADAPDDLQVIGVDDASPDDCGAILDDYASRDGRIRVVHLNPNRGLGLARNAGLDAAGGEYVWFVDGDDVLTRGAVTAVSARLRLVRPDVLLLRHAWLVDDRIRPDPRGARVPRYVGLVSVDERPRLLRVRQAAWNRVARRGLLERPWLRFPEGWYEDVAFSHLALVEAQRITTLPHVAYLYRQRGGAITATQSPRHFEVFRQYELLFEALTSASAPVRAELFELMLEHYLVIVGTEGRVPEDMRQDFFGRIVEHYHRYLPAQGYERPHGMAGLKQRFVRWDAYGLFHAFRSTYRAGLSWGGRLRPGRTVARDVPAKPDESPRIASRPTR